MSSIQNMPAQDTRTAFNYFFTAVNITVVYNDPDDSFTFEFEPNRILLASYVHRITYK